MAIQALLAGLLKTVGKKTAQLAVKSKGLKKAGLSKSKDILKQEIIEDTFNSEVFKSSVQEAFTELRRDIWRVNKRLERAGSKLSYSDELLYHYAEKKGLLTKSGRISMSHLENAIKKGEVTIQDLEKYTDLENIIKEHRNDLEEENRLKKQYGDDYLKYVEDYQSILNEDYTPSELYEILRDSSGDNEFVETITQSISYKIDETFSSLDENGNMIKDDEKAEEYKSKFKAWLRAVYHNGKADKF